MKSLSRFILFFVSFTTLAAGARQSDECQIDFAADLRIDQTSLTFTPSDGQTITLDEKNRLIIDGEVQQLSPEQQQLIDAYAEEIRFAVPEVVELIQEATDIGVEAALLVLSNLFVLADDDEAFKAGIQRVETGLKSLQKEVLADYQLDHIANRDEEIEQKAEAIAHRAVTTLLPEVASMAIKTLLSNGESLKEFQAQTENLEEMIEQHVETRAESLEPRAQRLCERVRHLDAIETELTRRGITEVDFFSSDKVRF